MTTTPKKPREFYIYDAAYGHKIRRNPNITRMDLTLTIVPPPRDLNFTWFQTHFLVREILPTDVTLPRVVVEQVLDQMNYMHPGTEITRALESALKSHSQEGQG